MFLRRFNFLVFLLSATFLLNCTTISLSIPGATIESSETAGKNKKELGPSLEPAREIEYSDSVNARPPDLDNAKVLGGTHNLINQAHFGLGESFELGGELAIDLGSDVQAAFMLVGKFQFIGSPKDKAKQGDFSGALFGRLGYVSADGNGDQSVTFGAGGYPWSATVDAKIYMLGMSYGYRFIDPWLVYLGGSYQHITSEIKIDQNPADDNSDQGGLYTRDRNGRSYSYGLGSQLRIGNHFYLHGKLMMFHFYMDGVADLESLYGAGGFHFYF